MEFFKVVAVSMLTDIDNMVILGSIISKYYFKGIQFYAVILLAITRTIYVYSIERFINLPGFHLVLGFLIFILAFKIVFQAQSMDRHRGEFGFHLKGMLLLLGTDFLICLDGVVTMTEISQNVIIIFLGFLLGLSIIIFAFPVFVKLIRIFPWLNIFVGGFMAHIGVIAISKDVLFQDRIMEIDALYPKLNFVNLFADFSMILIVLIGLIIYLNSIERKYRGFY